MRWTLAEFERLTESGILKEDDHIELIGGELVPMSPKGNRHEVVRGAFLNWLRRNLADEFDFHAEPGWRAGGTDYIEPDFLVGPAGCNPTSVSPADVVLVIEIAHSSLRFDTTSKASGYASLGLREYWVIDAETLATRVHREPSPKGYGSITEVLPGDRLASVIVPSLALKLADLSLT
jgi:Uma2 family endonuclease